ncbi:hypothetical protein ACFQ16_30390 [Saccharopolyspora rosea]|uniref:Uncharacterized protein n=1 Tax=Saccharopolyspora rosea TaxID=524884 RepID=A0ABW3G5W7_9PSEU
MTRRHATAVRPGAQPAGEWIPAVCGVCVRVPFATPHGRLPRSVLVTERCRECGDIVADRGFRARDWDF